MYFSNHFVHKLAKIIYTKKEANPIDIKLSRKQHSRRSSPLKRNDKSEWNSFCFNGHACMHYRLHSMKELIIICSLLSLESIKSKWFYHVFGEPSMLIMIFPQYPHVCMRVCIRNVCASLIRNELDFDQCHPFSMNCLSCLDNNAKRDLFSQAQPQKELKVIVYLQKTIAKSFFSL